MQSSLPAAGSTLTSYHSSPYPYIIINFNIPSSSLPPPAPTQPVIGNGQEVLAAAAKPDAPQNTNMVPLRLAASAAAVLQPQKKRLLEERPPQIKVPATPKDPLTQNRAPITAHAKSDIKYPC
ncbi:hypothetical protein F4604DRAFT_1923469 [Suillus subluteus]|nr:hypothetical protein F4604DRAFT_1923469 [Suillus subluteus]